MRDHQQDSIAVLMQIMDGPPWDTDTVTDLPPVPPLARIVVLVPAHDEVNEIGRTLAAIYGQTLPPDEVHVLTDNAVPGLAEAAARFPCSITCTLNNRYRKAGNLNADLSGLLPQLADHDIVMGFDADGIPDPDFIENAISWLDRGYGAVGATFHGRAGGSVLGLLQRAEFARFARQQARRPKCDVLSGTGWAVRAGVLRLIASTRPDGMVYDVRHITEDFELTLALRHAGVAAVSPTNCRVTTDVMVTGRNWASQRQRWQHGTLAALGQYGWTDETRGIIMRQVLTYLVMLMTPLVAVYMAWSFLLFGLAGIDPANAPLYAVGLAVVIFEQAWQARKAGPAAVLVTLLIVPDFLYSVARQVVYVRAAVKWRRGKDVSWGAGMGF